MPIEVIIKNYSNATVAERASTPNCICMIQVVKQVRKINTSVQYKRLFNNYTIDWSVPAVQDEIIPHGKFVTKQVVTGLKLWP